MRHSPPPTARNVCVSECSTMNKEEVVLSSGAAGARTLGPWEWSAGSRQFFVECGQLCGWTSDKPKVRGKRRSKDRRVRNGMTLQHVGLEAKKFTGEVRDAACTGSLEQVTAEQVCWARS